MFLFSFWGVFWGFVFCFFWFSCLFVGFFVLFLISISAAELDTIFVETPGFWWSGGKFRNVTVEVSVFLGTVIFIPIFCPLRLPWSWSQGVGNKWALGYEIQGVWLDESLIHSFVNIILNFLYIFSLHRYLCFFIEQCVFWRPWFPVLYLKAQKKALVCFFNQLFRLNWILIIIPLFFSCRPCRRSCGMWQLPCTWNRMHWHLLQQNRWDGSSWACSEASPWVGVFCWPWNNYAQQTFHCCSLSK